MFVDKETLVFRYSIKLVLWHSKAIVWEGQRNAVEMGKAMASWVGGGVKRVRMANDPGGQRWRPRALVRTHR